MAIKLNGTTINKITLNTTTINKVTLNGTIVYDNSTGSTNPPEPDSSVWYLIHSEPYPPIDLPYVIQEFFITQGDKYIYIQLIDGNRLDIYALHDKNKTLSLEGWRVGHPNLPINNYNVMVEEFQTTKTYLEEAVGAPITQFLYHNYRYEYGDWYISLNAK